ncbi:MAG: S-layer homology domain-containing protein [Deltaproteobacteria bacterium]|nr:S-layer homology domain-containing protein [Deltaproteobacteria bacterium]
MKEVRSQKPEARSKKPKNCLVFLSLFTVYCLLFAAFYGCAKPVAKCTTPEDNPPHHYARGMEFLEHGKISDAEAKFERALYCDEHYSPAHAGLAMVNALKAKDQKEPGYRQTDTNKGMDHLKHAKKLANTKEDEFAYHVAGLRVYTALKTKNWLDDAEDHFKDAAKLNKKVDERKLLYYEGVEAAPYFMGIAYLEAREFQKARDKFSEVLNMKREGKWNEKADKGWKRVDKIVRAMGGITLGDVGKEIAVMESVNRGDMAALLADELKIDKLFAGRIPVKSEIDKLKAEFTPADMLNHHFKEEALTMMKWGIRGLEPQYDQTTKAYLFKPDEGITRKEFALVLEDILIKLTGDAKIATAYFGQEKSPFPDVPATASWYNAVMNMTSRGLMEPELSGEFRINDLLDGAEAILAIRVLRQRMNIY